MTNEEKRELGKREAMQQAVWAANEEKRERRNREAMQEAVWAGKWANTAVAIEAMEVNDDEAEGIVVPEDAENVVSIRRGRRRKS